MFSSGTEDPGGSAVKWFIVHPPASQSLPEMMSLAKFTFDLSSGWYTTFAGRAGLTVRCSGVHCIKLLLLFTALLTWQKKHMAISALVPSVAQHSTSSLGLQKLSSLMLQLEATVGLVYSIVLTLLEGSSEIPCRLQELGYFRNPSLWWENALSRPCLFRQNTIGFGSIWMFIRYSKFIKWNGMGLLAVLLAGWQ